MGVILGLMISLISLDIYLKPSIYFDEANNEISTERHFAFLVDPAYHRRLLEKPPGLKHQQPDEAEYLKLHRCKDHGEVYAASYLVTKQYLLKHHIDFNLSTCNTELASFMMMDTKMDEKKDRDGTIIQSLDVLDFSVIHLSAYERLQRRHRISKGDKTHAIRNSTIILKSKYEAMTHEAIITDPSKARTKHPDANRTVAIMPWLGSEMGAGNSNINNRLEYLKACFWSLYIEFPHVVVAVKSMKDYDIAKNFSGLPWYDVMVLGDLPNSQSLPVATVQVTRNRILTGEWKHFDFIYFTESDQVLMMRHHDIIYGHLHKYPRRVLVPHRLIPYPEQAVAIHKREISKVGDNDWTGMNCCMPRQNCVTRSTWVNAKSMALSFLNIFGLQVALGNCNFHSELFRACTLYPKGGVEICP